MAQLLVYLDVLFSWIAWPMVWFSILAAVVLLIVGIYFCYNKYVELDDKGAGSSIEWKFISLLDNFTNCKKFWLASGKCWRCSFLQSQKPYRLDASCGFYRLDESLSSSCIKPVGFIKLHQAVGFIKLNKVCWLHQVASSLLASSSCIKSVSQVLILEANVLQAVEATCIKLL